MNEQIEIATNDAPKRFAEITAGAFDLADEIINCHNATTKPSPAIGSVPNADTPMGTWCEVWNGTYAKHMARFVGYDAESGTPFCSYDPCNMTAEWHDHARIIAGPEGGENMSYRNRIEYWTFKPGLLKIAEEADAEIAALKAENERLADLLADALAYTPDWYSQAILRVLEKKARAK